MFISDEDTRTRNVEILSNGGKEIYKLYETWKDVYGDLTEQEFFGWMMAYEMNGLQRNKFSLNAKPVTVLSVIKDVVARQLFGDSLKSGGHMPYCYSSECTNGLFNFLANYAQVARDRTGDSLPNPLDYPVGYQQDNPVMLLRDELLADSASFTHDVLNASPSSKTYGDDLPYHWGNADWVAMRSFGTTHFSGLVYQNGNFLIFTANQGPKR